MTELADLQDRMYHEMIEAPEEMERILINTAKEVAQKLYFHPSNKVSFEFAEHKYRAIYTTRIVNFKKNLIFIAIDEARKNVPIRAVAEIDNNFSEFENLRATIAAFLRNRIGMDTAEELEEDPEEDRVFN